MPRDYLADDIRLVLGEGGTAFSMAEALRVVRMLLDVADAWPGSRRPEQRAALLVVEDLLWSELERAKTLEEVICGA